mmetsp:Transcript_16160/g.20314  ORF Transcript_16160/g.20314 Transcript_16160/m.20314 type:complete len:80 (+) Transcript_16160:1766-2005(+)
MFIFSRLAKEVSRADEISSTCFLLSDSIGASSIKCRWMQEDSEPQTGVLEFFQNERYQSVQGNCSAMNGITIRTQFEFE